MALGTEWLKKKVQISIEGLFKHRVYCFSHRKHGHQSYADIKHSGQHMGIIFDIGANIGQSAIEYMVAFPDAQVFSFEPVSTTYAALKNNIYSDKTRCYHLAMGKEKGFHRIFLNENSTTNSFIPQTLSMSHEMVEVTTVDIFTSENSIEKIDLLKIDTEGFDLEVLKGSEEMLSAGRVAFIQVEVGFHPCDKRHVLFDEVRDFLIQKRYSVFGFYDQFLEWSGEKRLRFANVLFYHEEPFVSKDQML